MKNLDCDYLVVVIQVLWNSSGNLWGRYDRLAELPVAKLRFLGEVPQMDDGHTGAQSMAEL